QRRGADGKGNRVEGRSAGIGLVEIVRDIAEHLRGVVGGEHVADALAEGAGAVALARLAEERCAGSRRRAELEAGVPVAESRAKELDRAAEVAVSDRRATDNRIGGLVILRRVVPGRA